MIMGFNKTINVILAICVAFASVLTTSCCNNTESTLKCNYKVADITPKDSVILAGFAARKGLSIGVHKPLESRCLVLQKGSEKICIVSNDLMECGTSTVDRWRAEISQKSGLPVENIFIHN